MAKLRSGTKVFQPTVMRQLSILQPVDGLPNLQILSWYLVISPVPLYYGIVDSLCVYVFPFHIYARKPDFALFAEGGLWLIIILQLGM